MSWHETLFIDKIPEVVIIPNFRPARYN